MSSSEVHKLNQLINDIRVGMFTTMKKLPGREQEEYLHSRPMYALKFDENERKMYFFSSWHSLKNTELDKCNDVNISFSDPTKNVFVSISGEAVQNRSDRQKMRELWTPMCKTYFPKGVDDPELSLIIVTVKHVEYWDVHSRTMVEEAKAWFTEKVGMAPPARPESDHGTIEL